MPRVMYESEVENILPLDDRDKSHDWDSFVEATSDTEALIVPLNEEDYEDDEGCF